MNVTTTQILIDGAAEFWREQYLLSSGQYYDEGKRVIYERLVALVNPTATDINTVIGNGSWTRLTCDECGRDVGATVRVGSDEGYDSPNAAICIDCLKRALALFEGKAK